MKILNQALLTGERALFKAQNLHIVNCVFENGESPLKESRNIRLEDDIFRWKYPIWYSKHVRAQNITLLDTARSGIWYTFDIEISNSLIQAPKTFRRGGEIKLTHVRLPNAQETLWSCRDVYLEDVSANGDYFAMNAQKIIAKDFTLSGNYAFDGAKDIAIDNAHITSKDAFWNCENVVVKNSTIVGEYLGWNSKNVTFINCTIESNQGMCYMDNVKTVNCKIIHTDLAFEYSNVDIDATTIIDSIKNPLSGAIQAQKISEIIFDDKSIDPSKTQINVKENDDGAL